MESSQKPISKALVGIVAFAIIVFSTLYLVTSITPFRLFSSQSAAVISSQTRPAVSVVNDEIFDQKLYSLVTYFNERIGEVVLIKKEEIKSPVTVSAPATGVAVTRITSSAVGASSGVSGQSRLSVPSVSGVSVENPVQNQELELENEPESLESLLLARNFFMRKLAESNPQLFLLVGFPTNVKSKIPASLQSEIETKFSGTGQLEVIHADDFEHPENSDYFYSIRIGNKKFTLYPTRDLSLQSGVTLRLEGVRIGDVVVADNRKITEVASGPGPADLPPLESVGEQRVLALLINFQDSGAPTITREQVEDSIFNGQFQDFYKEQSYDKVFFTGDVSGWHTLPRNCNSDWPLLFGGDEDDIEGLIARNGIDLNQFDRIALVFPNNCSNGTQYSGYGTIGKTYFADQRISFAWIRANSLFRTLSHEMGHNLGIWHANGLDCGTQVLGSNCEHVEYGNYFDTMGDSRYSRHFNAFYKELLGWIMPEENIVITESGRYTINTLEKIASSSPVGIKRFAKIQRPFSSETPFYLEYRKAVGFDSILGAFPSNQSGLFVNHISPESTFEYGPHLLDMEPTGANWFIDSQGITLNGTATFTDTSTGITIGPIIQAASSTITFDVGINPPVCVRHNPLVEELDMSPFLTPGSNYVVSINFGNGDSSSCGPSFFDIETGFPASWQPRVVPVGNMQVVPTDTGELTDYKDIFFHVPTDAPLGVYRIKNSVINKTTGYKTDLSEIEVRLANRPVVTSISPRTGSVGTTVHLTGSDFGSRPLVYFSRATQISYSNMTLNSDGGSFTIPTSMFDFDCEENCNVPTLPGIYRIVIMGEVGSSVPVYFEVTP